MTKSVTLEASDDTSFEIQFYRDSSSRKIIALTRCVPNLSETDPDDTDLVLIKGSAFGKWMEHRGIDVYEDVARWIRFQTENLVNIGDTDVRRYDQLPASYLRDWAHLTCMVTIGPVWELFPFDFGRLPS